MNTRTLPGLVALLLMLAPLAAIGVGAQSLPASEDCPGTEEDDDLLFVALCQLADELGAEFTTEDADGDGRPDRAVLPGQSVDPGAPGTPDVTFQVDFIAEGGLVSPLATADGVQVYAGDEAVTLLAVPVEHGSDDEGGYYAVTLPGAVPNPLGSLFTDEAPPIQTLHVQESGESDLDNDGDSDMRELRICLTNPFNPAAHCGDHDGDGTPNADDPEPRNPPVQDADGDGVPDGTDNCEETSNPDQKDTDEDGAGDACDADDDEDGISDADELAGFTITPKNADGTAGTARTVSTNPLLKDTDGDGLEDKDELDGWDVSVRHRDGNSYTYHVQSDPTADNDDGDGLPDGDERRYGTNPYVTDTDGDGLSDKDEADDDEAAEDPLGLGIGDADPLYRPADPNADPTDYDTDGDGTGDGDEVAASDDPNDSEPTTGVEDLAGTGGDAEGLVGTLLSNVIADESDAHDTDGDGVTEEPNGQDDMLETRVLYVDQDEADYDAANDDPQHGFRGTDGATLRVYEPNSLFGQQPGILATLRVGDVTATEQVEVLVVEVSGAATVCVLQAADHNAVHAAQADFDPDADAPCGGPAADPAEALGTILGLLEGSGVLEVEVVDEDADGIPEALVLTHPSGPCDPTGQAGPPCELTETVVPVGGVPDACPDADEDGTPDCVQELPVDPEDLPVDPEELPGSPEEVLAMADEVCAEASGEEGCASVLDLLLGEVTSALDDILGEHVADCDNAPGGWVICRGGNGPLGLFRVRTEFGWIEV